MWNECGSIWDSGEPEKKKGPNYPYFIRRSNFVHENEQFLCNAIQVTKVYMITFIDGSAKLACDPCRKTFSNKTQLLDHLLQHFEGFVCVHCGEIYESKAELEHHIETLDLANHGEHRPSSLQSSDSGETPAASESPTEEPEFVKIKEEPMDEASMNFEDFQIQAASQEELPGGLALLYPEEPPPWNDLNNDGSRPVNFPNIARSVRRPGPASLTRPGMYPRPMRPQNLPSSNFNGNSSFTNSNFNGNSNFSGSNFNGSTGFSSPPGMIRPVHFSGPINFHEKFPNIETIPAVPVPNPRLSRSPVPVLLKPEGGLYACDSCDFTTNVRKDFAKHVLQKHSDSNKTPKVQCPICQKLLCGKHSLQGHMYRKHKIGTMTPTVSANKTEQCHLCGKNFTVGGLRNHILKVHEKVPTVKTYPCEDCGMMFTKVADLREHTYQNHYKGKLHNCEVCGKTFANRRNLRKHKKGHNEERPTCEVCGQDFKWSNGLLKHLKKFHPEEHKRRIEAYNESVRRMTLTKKTSTAKPQDTDVSLANEPSFWDMSQVLNFPIQADEISNEVQG